VIYLDNAATTQVYYPVADRVRQVLVETFGNPSSLYDIGFEAQKVVDGARKVVAGAMRCNEKEVIFTGSGTEGNNIAIFSSARARKSWGNKVVVTAYEHPSVQNCCTALREEGFEVTEIAPGRDGNVDIVQMSQAVDGSTVLVCCMAVNNETGARNDIAALAKAVRQANIRTALHCDFVQAFLKQPLDTAALGVDTLTVSAHKIHGPKGVGALFIRNGFHTARFLYGGGQEQKYRSGTENVAGIAGFAKAVETSGGIEENTRHVTQLRDRLKAGIEAIPEFAVNSPHDASPYIFNFSMPGTRSETIIRYLSAKGIYVSGGSACHKGARSHTLEAMKLPDSLVDGAVRVSFCAQNTQQDVDALLAGVRDAWRDLAKN